MPQGKHRASHRATPTRRILRRPRLAVVAAPIATVSVVGAGMAFAGHVQVPADASASLGHAALDRPATAALSAATQHSLASSAVTGATRSLSISRSLDRLSVPAVTAHRWTTAPLDLRFGPGGHAATDGEIAASKKIAVTGEQQNGYAQVVVDRQVRWVTASYLADAKPAPDPAAQGVVLQPCAATASVESGLVPGAIRAWEAVCNAFPQVTTFGGLANRPEHDTGHAVDAMIDGDSALGMRIAAFLQAHAAELDLYDIIWQQHIWTPVRASEGWRSMSDRGSATANHYDHVHVSVN